MNAITKNVIFDAISLFEFSMEVGFFSLAIASQNLYLFVLGVFFMGKLIPEKITKRILKDSSLSKRPENAKDCNLFNKGGPSTTPGFPSGHTTASWFLFTYTLLEFIRLRKENRNILSAVILTGVFAILVPIARSPYGLGCHT
ncbi:MAG: phosphatase PAP2 family protein, partial [bacterium]